ncbi:MAG: BlaI/MecI/CopY family transcriptional regulator, partial [Planctomycetales bacterium]|nr:BlaI/MecI/CopY family transcriptional regulator [Planctomycetales bacterium]
MANSFVTVVEVNSGVASMARHASTQPTDVELQILRVLWDDGPSTARHVHEALQCAKQTTYSTTVKMLSVMLEKGLVRRDEEASPHRYRAAVTRESAGKRLVKELVEKVYDGAAMSLVLQALKGAK